MNAEKKSKRVVFTMGGKGGVGKTGLMVALAEWFEANEIPFTLLDLDTENKARGSLKHFFNGSVAKVNIHTPAGLDAFVDYLEFGTPIILADMGAGSGQVASDWFDAMYEDVAAPARASLQWALSRQTRQALRVFSLGRTDCRIGRNI
jgi:MinD-like ATPase involved in chromosome partitioning or flagellar assembly